jgi:hypothetical protein
MKKTMNKYIQQNRNVIKINRNTPISMFSSGIFTKACNNNSTPTRKCRLYFLKSMLSIPVKTVPKGIT